MLGFAGLLLVGLYFCDKKGVIPTTGTPIRRDEHPRIFAATIAALSILAIAAAISAVAIFCWFGLNLISN
jgi:hypothetical protein